MFGVMAGGLSQIFADEFQRFGPSVGNGWLEVGTWQMQSSQQVQRVSSGTLDALYRAESYADQYAECIPLTDRIGPVVRYNPTDSAGGYLAYALSGDLFLEKNGPPFAWQNIASAGGAAPNLTTDRLRVEAIGGQITVYVNDVQAISAADSSWPTGHPGIAVQGVSGPSSQAADAFRYGI